MFKIKVATVRVADSFQKKLPESELAIFLSEKVARVRVGNFPVGKSHQSQSWQFSCPKKQTELDLTFSLLGLKSSLCSRMVHTIVVTTPHENKEEIETCQT